MSTAYVLSDSLPKDAGGAKFAGWVDVGGSQLDFSLPAGIGAKTTGSKIASALWSGNGLAGCKIEPTGGVGNVLMAHFASNASPTAVQNAIHLRGDDRGALFVSSLSATACLVSAASTETVTTASGLLYRVMVSASGAVSGAQLAILNGGTSLGRLVFDSAFQTLPVMDFGPHGTCFGSLRLEKIGTVGPVYVNCQYRNYGQG